MNRISTGIKGFDELVEGGFPEGSTVLVAGLPGAGKTIFGLQFIYNGAMNGENGVYICIESSPAELREQASMFGMDFNALEEQGKVEFLRIPKGNVRFNLFQLISKAVEGVKAERIVFDNIATYVVSLGRYVSLWDEMFKAPEADKKENSLTDDKAAVYSIIEQLKSLGRTCLVITHGDASGARISSDGMSEYLCDGIIKIDIVELGREPTRIIKVAKMRQTKNILQLREFEITQRGIEIS
ncbi:MAG: hypothetical protein M1321_00430 [Candidatus Marsarchaeota archaeon]|nr:hypothetical protein [Candidatus Marsarchaeota archaeon]